jgi:hypothetical protein
MPVVSFSAFIVVAHPLFAIRVLVVTAVFQSVRPVSVLGDLPDHDFPDCIIVVNKMTSEEKACRYHMVFYTINEEYAMALWRK